MPGGIIRWFAVISSLTESLSCQTFTQFNQENTWLAVSFQQIFCPTNCYFLFYLSNLIICDKVCTFMRDKEETMLGKFWLISCIDCRGSEAWTILWAVWCPKSVQGEKIIIIIAVYEINKRKTINCKYPSVPKHQEYLTLLMTIDNLWKPLSQTLVQVCVPASGQTKMHL